jgi:hypothetical protein
LKVAKTGDLVKIFSARVAKEKLPWRAVCKPGQFLAFWANLF